ncbi:MAG: class I SAM-dependent methyltransferase [Pseudomonadota bacterium]|nr:class I SAM-dependent methyltransferase [Pseudomonadota bacterium]
MLLYLFERIKRVLFDVALCFVRNPNLKFHSLNLKFKHEGDLSQISEKFGIRLETLQRQRDTGLDNPAYRFHRDEGFLSYFASHAEVLKGCSWLDVGANTGAVSLYLSEILDSSNFELCDITVARRSNFPVKKIAGTHLDYESNSFDLVFFSYVLHHAADNTIQLLRDAHRIARKYVVVTEDPKETQDDYLWAYMHDRGGTFRGRKEWRELFSTLGFSVVYEKALDCQPHSRHFFLLAPNKVSTT